MRDSQQITLSPNVSGGETKFAAGQLPSLFHPIRVFCECLSSHVIYRCMPLLPASRVNAAGNMEVVAAAIFFLHVYFKSTCVNNYQLISSFWGLFDLVIFSPLFFLLCQTLEHSFTLISSTWPCSCHLCVSFHHKKSITAISCVAARTPCEHFSYMCSRVSFSAGPRVLGDFNVADEWGSQISSVFEKTIRLDS